MDATAKPASAGASLDRMCGRKCLARVVVQRVRRASVAVNGETIAEIGPGFLLLVGVGQEDTEREVERVADKVAVLRVFEDDEGKMNRSAADVGGSMLAVSQFTLYGDVSKGRRPSFVRAARPEAGERLYDHFVRHLRSRGFQVECGRFGAHMLVSLENDGPVTVLIDSEAL